MENKEERKPLKVAAAIKYDPEKNVAPIILAKGKGSIAEEIIRIAEENDVPLYQDAALAKLLGTLELETEIPPEMYSVVAEVLAFVYKLEQKRKGKSKFDAVKTNSVKKDSK
ncbi:MAG: EscU/YscU/HrcU family type III secretion system export apparatus switch protein [Candidatus Margulisbacteria bacterium]|nr:EscU/YscU/HrcU family type III secretion system export apparatus switch protein [Candidatus Margulisiibacteriota bacterium]